VAALTEDDLRGIRLENVKDLHLDVQAFLALLDGTASPGDGAAPTAIEQQFGVRPKRRKVARGGLVTATPASTLAEVIDRVADAHCHTVFVVDGRERALGVLILADLIRSSLCMEQKADEAARKPGGCGGEDAA